MKYLIILSVIAAASAISFIDVSREEWTTFKVSIPTFVFLTCSKVCTRNFCAVLELHSNLKNDTKKTKNLSYHHRHQTEKVVAALFVLF